MGFNWDDNLPEEITSKWNSWTSSLISYNKFTVPRSVCTKKGSQFILHGFADASQQAVCAAVYVVEHDCEHVISQNLLVAKSRVAPKSTSIPRLELVAAHTLARLMDSTMKALKTSPITKINYWSDSTTVLHWLASQGTWTIFVRNRVKKINELSQGSWRYVPTAENPSDLGTRGVLPSKLGTLWFKGPNWLGNPKTWPSQPEIIETAETLNEVTTRKDKSFMTNETQHVNKSDLDFIEIIP